jgi:hypothetical protein
MTSNQILSRKRNWNKFQLNGGKILLDKNALTENELKVLKEIQDRVEILKEHWNVNTKALGLKVGVRYKVLSTIDNKLLSTNLTTKDIKWFKQNENFKIIKI